MSKAFHSSEPLMVCHVQVSFKAKRAFHVSANVKIKIKVKITDTHRDTTRPATTSRAAAAQPNHRNTTRPGWHAKHGTVMWRISEAIMPVARAFLHTNTKKLTLNLNYYRGSRGDEGGKQILMEIMKKKK